MSGWTDALRMAELFVVDPVGIGGIAVRAGAGPVREAWMAALGQLVTATQVIRRMPVGIADDRLLGGLDLAATLAQGRPVIGPGLLAEADGGVVVCAMAERMTAATAARLTAAIDTCVLAVERDGFAVRSPARLGIVALDEGDEDQRPPVGLLDRLGFRLDLDEIGYADIRIPGAAVLSAPHVPAVPQQGAAMQSARTKLHAVTISPELLDALTQTAVALGITSLRAPMMAARCAQAAAALDGRGFVSDDDASEAARLVLAPRATILPPPADAAAPPERSEREIDHTSAPDDGADEEAPEPPLADILLAAARAAIPPDLLAQIAGSAARSRAAGRAGASQKATARGRPAGTRVGELRAGARLDVLATLRAAAPWQRLRGVQPAGRIAIRAGDFRISRRVQKARTTTIFLVDASGSSALNRLAEAKGAVEMLLAECYVRRDQVALIAFRGRAAELVLPPTGSLTRARRCLAGLPGGGGTPLAAALAAAATLADSIRRRDGVAVVVLLTDGRANVARDGTGQRERAIEEALAEGRALRSRAISSLLIDTSPRPQPAARDLATAMGAVYLALPQGDASAMFRAAKAAGA